MTDRAGTITNEKQDSYVWARRVPHFTQHLTMLFRRCSAAAFQNNLRKPKHYFYAPLWETANTNAQWITYRLPFISWILSSLWQRGNVLVAARKT